MGSSSSQVSGCSAFETTSPDWVFGLMLSAGIVALTTGGVWVAFLPGLVKGPPKGPQPRGKYWWLRWVLLLFVMANFVYSQFLSRFARDEWARTPDRYINAVILAATALPLAGVFVASRRHRATGVWPSGWRAPWGLFWLLPIVFVAAVGAGLWAFATMADSSVSVPC